MMRVCCGGQAGLEEARAGQLEALVGSLRGAAYRAAADSQATGSRAAGAESHTAQLQAQASTLGGQQNLMCMRPLAPAAVFVSTPAWLMSGIHRPGRAAHAQL